MQSRIVKFPVIKPFVKTIDADIAKFGLQGAMMNTVVRSGTKLVVTGKTPEVERVLKEEAVVLVANHPHEVDIVALFAALPNRADTSLIISSRFMNLAPNADKYLIPVYVDHHTDKGLQLREEFFKMFHKVPTYSPEEEHERNILSIKLASEKVKKGGLLIIFPNPSKDANKKWYSGVGHLLKGAKSKKSIYVVKAHIEGTSNMDYLRFIPKAAKLLTPIYVTFDKPRKVNDILDKDPKEIATQLELEYRTWEKKILR